MTPKKTVAFIAVVLAWGVCAVDADMVILKSGEMFQTPKAWKENGVVAYQKNGRVVRLDANQVERLIQTPGAAAPPPADQPIPDRSAPAADQPPAPILPAGDDAGYLALKWGQPPSQIEDLTWVGTDPAYGGVQLYARKQGGRHFGRASVDNIFYGFWQEGLYTILVEVSNFLDFRDLRAEAFRRYGEVRRSEKNPEKYHWSDEVSDRLLSYDDKAGEGYLWMRSRKLHATVSARYPDASAP